ncbi:hypothetical protein BgiMline_005332 [Biomphalaria glabrata]
MGSIAFGLQPVSDCALWLWFAASLRLCSMALVCSQSRTGLYSLWFAASLELGSIAFGLQPVSDWAL